MLRDVQYGFSTMRRNPGFTVLTLILGIQTLTMLCFAAIAMFGGRRSLCAAYPEVGEFASRLSNRVACCSWLDTVFRVLDDEPLVVIEPSTRTGILAHLSGTDINFTLAMLLMHQFPGRNGQPQQHLSAKAASVLDGGPQCSNETVIGTWNLYNWQALQSDCSLPGGQEHHEHWIWNEGTPADIAVLEGRRVILLGPPAYRRTWQAQRTFATLKPSLRIEKELTDSEVQSWLDKIIRAQTAPSEAGV